MTRVERADFAHVKFLRLGSSILVAVALCFFATPVNAQDTTKPASGTISGTVTKDNKSVPNVSVRLFKAEQFPPEGGSGAGNGGGGNGNGNGGNGGPPAGGPPAGGAPPGGGPGGPPPGSSPPPPPGGNISIHQFDGMINLDHLQSQGGSGNKPAGPHGNPVASAPTDKDGKFKFPNVAPGDYVVAVINRSIGNGRTDATVTSGEDTSVSIVLMPPPPPTNSNNHGGRGGPPPPRSGPPRKPSY